jgi:hypothetical protein
MRIGRLLGIVLLDLSQGGNDLSVDASPSLTAGRRVSKRDESRRIETASRLSIGNKMLRRNVDRRQL